jgi:hypothetical protein
MNTLNLYKSKHLLLIALAFIVFAIGCIDAGGGYGNGYGYYDPGNYGNAYGPAYGAWGQGYNIGPVRGGDFDRRGRGGERRGGEGEMRGGEHRGGEGGGHGGGEFRAAPASRAMPSIPSGGRSGGGGEHGGGRGR